MSKSDPATPAHAPDLDSINDLAHAAREGFAVWRANPTPAAWRVASDAEDDFRNQIEPADVLWLVARARRAEELERGQPKGHGYGHHTTEQGAPHDD